MLLGASSCWLTWWACCSVFSSGEHEKPRCYGKVWCRICEAMWSSEWLNLQILSSLFCDDSCGLNCISKYFCVGWYWYISWYCCFQVMSFETRFMSTRTVGIPACPLVSTELHFVDLWYRYRFAAFWFFFSFGGLLYIFWGNYKMWTLFIHMW